MPSTAVRLEGLAFGTIIAIAIAGYAYLLYQVPDALPPETTNEPSNRNFNFRSLLGWIIDPIRIAWPHIHIPFLPFTYLFSFLYTILYPAVAILQVLLYAVTSPILLLYAASSVIYPFYVFFGIAALVGLAVGSGCAGIAHLIWALDEAKG
ncbi:hypothetical protein DACRYDRAFT_110733 [Dacryopinax primogenitus]|uniref:Transmembrane protein n=1 Tax=Dacryopinax primogenitus (strain DJM 731) TaxID=1858805 RepID=M5G518_DACPD|nr:uncharacterized protein DACRYDRAFT_110733 [Dacryopinax primogenitus]EJT98847.1 hypothetical protein DACRYDRAFT_110733 [Dacryopinax primogenitus]